MRCMTNRLLAGAAAALALVTGPAQSQGRLEADVLKNYGGVYSADCGNPGMARLRVLADALVVEQGNQRIAGREVMAAYSYFGKSPPANYSVALLSQVPRADGLLFIVYQDRQGQYIQIDADPKVRAALGKTIVGARHDRCNAQKAQSQPAAAAPSAPPPVGTSAMVNPSQLLRDPLFRRAYLTALGPRANQRWLTRLDGPATPTSRVRVAGKDYVLAASCKNQDCGDNNLVLLYSAQEQAVYGKLLEAGRPAFFGAPPPAIAVELERLWKKEWRQGQ